MSDWARGPLLGFDTETTGVDPQKDRIVSAALVLRDRRRTVSRSWLLDPGVEIPAAALAVHGITTREVRLQGRAPAAALAQVAERLTAALTRGIPVVAFNAPFDLTILQAELARHGLPGLEETLVRRGPVLDPLVIDRGADGGRAGPRRLADLLGEYGIGDRAGLHTAAVDARATLDLLAAMLRRHPVIGDMDLASLQEWQRLQYRAWLEQLDAVRGAASSSAPPRSS